jgi:hypothetical protein
MNTETLVQETPVQVDDAHFYLNELDKANKKIDELYHFIEMTEALTYDQATAKRINTFLKQQGLWPEQQKN